MKRVSCCLLLLTIFSSSLTAGPAATPRDLAPILKPLVEQYHFPGVVGAIIHGKQIVALGSIGVRKTGNPAPFLPTDSLHLGSDTKAMTAILIGQLIDKKLISLDSKMGEIFPEYAGKMNPQMAKVTVRNLLNHNAGFPHDLDWWSLHRTGQSLRAQRKLAVQQALSAAPAHPIGKFFYSNVSFVLLGAIVEAKLGESWEDVIREKIFQPLDMPSAGFGPPSINGSLEQPWGHTLKDGKLNPVQNDNAPVLGPAGTVHCSISDWSHFVAQIMLAAQGHSTLVSQATFDALIAPPSGQEYAGGWVVVSRPWAGGRALTHNGSNTTWFCTVWIAPNKNFAVLIATNTAGGNVDKVMDGAVALLINFNAKLPANP